MIKKYTNFIDSNIYLNAADALGYTFEIIDYNKSFAKITNPDNNKDLYIYENWLGINDQVAYGFAKNKYVSGKVLSKSVPDLIPDTIQLSSKDKDAINKLVKFAQKHLFSIVIKPNDTSLGTDVFVLPKDEAEIKKISTNLLKKYDFILGQKFIKAENEYRIVYLNGKFFDAVKRITAFVVGDGEKSINQLINFKNIDRSKNNFPLIIIDSDLKKILSNNGHSIDTILDKNQEVILKNVCSFAKGGETQRIRKEQFHPDYIKAFEKVTKISRLNFIGIDLMATNISIKPTSNDAINEINSAPMADLHYSADLIENIPFDSAKKLLTNILEN